MKIQRRRSQKGQAFIPMILMGVLVVGVIGIFAFEIGRAAMIRDQLRSATEAAALGGAASLAGSSQDNLADAQNKALDSAKSIFVRNEIFGTALTNVETDFNNSPALGHAKIRMTYLDINHKPVNIGDKGAKQLLVETKFGFAPVFATAIGMTNSSIPVEAQAEGGVGDLDVVLCFDFSGSMDDMTLMTHVRRRWDPNAGKIAYDIFQQGQLARSAGALQPQQLDGGSGFNPQLRGNPNTGAAPGNFPPGTAAVSGFTDGVVNLDEHTVYGGMSQDGFDFPNVGVLVEAARGNLENAAVFHSSQADTALGGVVAPKAGYQAEYFKLAKQHTHPIYEAQQAAEEFFSLMNRNSNAHFGLVSYDDKFGTTPTETFNQPNIAFNYSPGGAANFPMPGVGLQQPEAQTNFNEVTQGVDSLVAFGGTNIGGAVNTGIGYFPTGGRPNAKKVIILFTDGMPNIGSPLSGDPFQACQIAAQKAKAAGIAIYTVGMALDPSLIPIQQKVLGDNTPTGMAKIAGNGGKFYQVTSSNDLRTAFANIARQLTSLTE